MGWFKKIFKKESPVSERGSAQGKDGSKKVEKQAKVEVGKKTAEKMENIEPLISKKEIKLSADSIAHKVLLHPLVTEKSAIAESYGKYSFIVTSRATKTQVRNVIEDLYGEKPVAVNMINIEGRQLNFKRKPGFRSDYKKAVVTLKKGAKINIHTGV